MSPTMTRLAALNTTGEGFLGGSLNCFGTFKATQQMRSKKIRPLALHFSFIQRETISSEKGVTANIFLPASRQKPLGKEPEETG